MSHSFGKVASVDIQRSVFKRNSTHKTTMDANKLIPIFVDEVLPGDTFNLKQNTFARMATPIKPSMDNIYMDVHYFFVPCRLLWDNFEKFMGERKSPEDSIDFLIPTTVINGAESYDDYAHTILDYFGIPPIPVDTSTRVNALPFRAYNLIYNEWYRDQNLQDSVPFSTSDDGTDTPYVILNRGKRHDYFTSALPWPQKGSPVSLSLTGDAPIQGTFSVTSDNGQSGQFVADQDSVVKVTGIGGGNLSPAPEALFANLDAVTAVTIAQLRQAFQLQKFLERDARSGTRYIEVIKSHFGVTNPDFRLQRPEFLGGSRSRVGVTTIAQTSETSAGTPQGNLSAMAMVVDSDCSFNKSFTEHGYIIGIASAYADLTYQQGINRMWLRETRVDFFWPSFAHLGEQEVFNSEIYAQGTTADKELFGYQERYAEYRYSPSRISGLYRSSHPTSLDVWHYSEDFTSLPALSSEFIKCNSPIKRNSAVPTEPDFFCDFEFNLRCTRPIPMYGTPGFVDHF